MYTYSLQCVYTNIDAFHAETEGEWRSDNEIKIDNNGYVIVDGNKTKEFLDGCIRSKKKPLRLKIRNICGYETVWEV